MKMEFLQYENVWLTKSKYEEAETKFYEKLAKAPVTPLADEVAKARQLLIQSRDNIKKGPCKDSGDGNAMKNLAEKFKDFENTILSVLKKIDAIEERVSMLEQAIPTAPPVHEINVAFNPKKEDDDDVDLFASESEEESETAAKIKEERLAAYNARKATKPALIAKSNVILDVKPWDDETNMQDMENAVRKIEADGLLWGSAKLVPLAYGIHKLQISCVVEDEKISIDWLQEQMTDLEEYVQSVDIAAFNKI